MNLFNLFENDRSRRNKAHTIRDLFDRWTNSEYAPFNSDSGDYNEVIRKAEGFLQDIVDPSQVERLAHKLCDYWHGDDGMELDEKLGSQLVNRRQAHALITKFKRHSFEEDGTESESKREHSRGYSDAQKGIHKNPYNPHSPAHKAYEEGQQAYRRHFGESVDPQDQHKENHRTAVRAYHAKKKADKEQRTADSRGAFNNLMGGSPEDQTDFMNIRKKGVTENEQKIDMTGKKCTACKKGTYQETSQHDDMDGVLHCTKCNKSVKRHQSAKPKEKGVTEGVPSMTPNISPGNAIPVNKYIAKHLNDLQDACWQESRSIEDRMRRATVRSDWLWEASEGLEDLVIAFKHSLESGIHVMTEFQQNDPRMLRWIVKSIKSYTGGKVDLPVMIQQELANSKKGVAEGYDSADAYDKWDPKHPDFAKNYIIFAKNYKKHNGTNPPGGMHDFIAHLKKGVAEGKKVDRFVGYVEKSEEKAGKSKKDAESIAWATANKRGMLDNKNRKKVKEDSIADQTARDSRTMAQAFQSGQMKPKEYAPGEITLSQIYSHPKWRETVMAMGKKYPPDYTNQEVDQPHQIAAREAIKRMIQQGNIQEGLSKELSKWMKSTPGKRISEAGETNNYTANGFVGSDTGGGAFSGYRSQQRRPTWSIQGTPPPAMQYQKGPAPANPPEMQYQKGPAPASKTPFNFSDYEYGPDNTTIVPKKKAAPPNDSVDNGITNWAEPDDSVDNRMGQDKSAPTKKAAPPNDSVDNRMGQAMPAPTKKAPSDTSDPLAKNNSQYAVPNMPSSPVDTTNPLASNNSQYAVPPSVPTTAPQRAAPAPQSAAPAPQRAAPAPQKSRPGLAPGADPQVYDWQQELRKKNPALVADGLWGPGTDAEAKRQPDIKPPETAKPMPAQPVPRQQPAQPKTTAPEEPAQQTGPVTTTISSDEAERRKREGGVYGPKSGAEDYFNQHYNPDGTEKVQPAPVRPKPVPQPAQPAPVQPPGVGPRDEEERKRWMQDPTLNAPKKVTPAPVQPKPVPQPAQPAPAQPKPAPQPAQPAPPVKAQPSPEMGQAMPAPGYEEPAPTKKAPPGETKLEYLRRTDPERYEQEMQVQMQNNRIIAKDQLDRRINPQNYRPQTESKNNSKPKTVARRMNRPGIREEVNPQDGAVGQDLARMGVSRQDRLSQAFTDKNLGAGKYTAGTAASNLALQANMKKNSGKEFKSPNEKFASITQAPDGTFTITYHSPNVAYTGLSNEGQIDPPHTGIPTYQQAYTLVKQDFDTEQQATSVGASLQARVNERANRSKPKSMKRAANDSTGAKFGGYYKGTQKGAPRAGQGFGSMEEGAMGNMTVRSDPLTNLKKPEDLTMKAADPFKGNPNRNNLVSAQARNLVAKGAQTAGPGTGAHQNKALDVKKGDFRKLKHKGSFDFSESTNFLAWAMASGYNVIGNPAVYESAKYEYNMLLAEVKKKVKESVDPNAAAPAAAPPPTPDDNIPDLKPGQYFVWRVYFDDGTKTRMKITDPKFDVNKYYADKNISVINVDYNWKPHNG